MDDVTATQWGFEYVASPYTFKHHDKDTVLRVLQLRYEAALSYTHHRTVHGATIYSPIVHFHNVALAGDGLPKDFGFWQNINFNMLAKADRLVVLTLPGWMESKGVQGEMEFAQKLQIPISYSHWMDYPDALEDFQLNAAAA